MCLCYAEILRLELPRCPLSNSCRCSFVGGLGHRTVGFAAVSSCPRLLFITFPEARTDWESVGHADLAEAPLGCLAQVTQCCDLVESFVPCGLDAFKGIMRGAETGSRISAVGCVFTSLRMVPESQNQSLRESLADCFSRSVGKINMHKQQSLQLLIN